MRMLKKCVSFLSILLFSLVGIPLVFLLATFLSNFILQVISFCHKEWLVSKVDFAEFHPGYFWVKAILVAAGITAIIGMVVRLLLAKVKKEVSFAIFGFAAVVLSAAFILTIIERHLINKGFRPGVIGVGVGFEYKDSLVDLQNTFADERGMNYLARPRPWQEKRGVNSQGFISSFEYDTATIQRMRSEGKKIVFIIGDSFVEGVTEELTVPGQYDSTFVEMMRDAHPEYAVCAFGVGGTDPVNYSLIAEKFIPRLKPDVVVLVVCWNDVMEYDVPATPHVPAFWQTNCGWLKSAVPPQLTGGEQVVLHSSREAYDYYTSRFTVWKRNDLAARLLRSSCLLTNAYMNATNFTFYPVRKDSTTSYKYVKKVYDLSQAADSRLSIVFIPDIHRIDEINSLEKYRKIYGIAFKELLAQVHFPVNEITYQDFIGGLNQHFNDAGNRKFFWILDSLTATPLALPNEQH